MIKEDNMLKIILQAMVFSFAIVGFVRVMIGIGKWSQRMTFAIDELLEQRKRRLSNK